MEARKQKEGEDAMAAGAKCMKTGMFSRWKPDWDAASVHYEKAATAFRVAKALPQAMDAYVKASECHRNLDSNFYAAKHLETAGLIARDNAKEPAKAATFYEMASTIHTEQGNLDCAGEALSKGARAVEEEDPARGATLFMKACDLYDDEEEAARLLAAVETFKQAVSFLLRTKHLTQAAATLQKQARGLLRVGCYAWAAARGLLRVSWCVRAAARVLPHPYPHCAPPLNGVPVPLMPTSDTPIAFGRLRSTLDSTRLMASAGDARSRVS